MKYRLIIDEKHEEEIIIYSHSKNELILEIEHLINNQDFNLNGYNGEEIIKIDLNDVICFLVEDNKVFVLIGKEKYHVKYRLYEINNMLNNSFLKINQSCIANTKQIKKFRSTIGGTLEVIFKNGYHDFISRRELKNVKERLGL